MLEKLQDNGYALKDIAILVRTNQEGAQVADTLLAYKEEHPSNRYNYDIISDEALFVSGSTAVRFMVSLLRLPEEPRRPDERADRFIFLSSVEREIWCRNSGFSTGSRLCPANPFPPVPL